MEQAWVLDPQRVLTSATQVREATVGSLAIIEMSKLGSA